MSLEPKVTFKPVPTKPVVRPNTRATLRDLNSTRDIQVFRRRSLLRRLLQLLSGKEESK